MVGSTHETHRPDLRPRLTRQIAKHLSEGRCVIVVAGPAMGKTWLLDTVRARASATATLVDNSDPAEVATLLQGPTPLLATFGVEHYDAARGLTRQGVWVPMVNLTEKHLGQRVEPDAWQLSAGHPLILASLATDEGRAARANSAHDMYGAALENLQARWRALLALRPRSRTSLRDFGDLPDATRAAGYFDFLRKRHGDALKAELDWLACAGMVTRFIDGLTPGVLPVPGALSAARSAQRSD